MSKTSKERPKKVRMEVKDQKNEQTSLSKTNTESSQSKTSIVRYTHEEKREACAAYIVSGTAKLTSLNTGIPVQTLYGWMKTDWWKRLLEEVKWEHQELIEARLSDIVDKATEELVDRIKYGDVVITKDGERKRVPVKAKELDAIVDKHTKNLRLIRNQPTKLSAEVKFDADKLAREFADIAQRNRERIVSEQ